MERTVSQPILAFAVSILLLTVTNGCGPVSTSVPTQPAATQAASPTKDIPFTSSPAETAVPERNASVAELERLVGFDIKEPASLLSRGYTLERATLDQPTKSICLQYRLPAEGGDSILFVAQGPHTTAPPLELVPGWPEYALMKESISLGGAKNSLHLSGWNRTGWGCSAAAAKETTAFSYAIAPRLSWQAGDQQFDLYSASRGCETPGGLTTLDLYRLAEELTGRSTHPADELDPECLQSPAEAEQIASFEVKEPAYLPQDVSFYFATYEAERDQTITLLFLHEQHKEMGRFFQISQSTQKPSYFVDECPASATNPCELLHIGDLAVVYQVTGRVEQMDWEAGGFFFSLFRGAGEPGKMYKDELLKVIESMQ